MHVPLTSLMSVNDASRIIIDDFRVMLQIVSSPTDNCRGNIYDQNMFVAQATGLYGSLHSYSCKLQL